VGSDSLLILAGLAASGGTLVLCIRFLLHARRHYPEDGEGFFGQDLPKPPPDPDQR